MSQAYAQKKILVTGGAGFIGSHLVEALVNQHAQVAVFDSLAQGSKHNLTTVWDQIDFWQEDLSNQAALNQAMAGRDMCFHLAANASVPSSIEDPQRDFACNATGTLNVLQAARIHSAARCVIVSSGAVYGQPDTFPICEIAPLHPISPYGASKLASEALCRAFNASYGIRVQIARIFNTYGPRQPRFVMHDFYRKLMKDPTRLEILGNGNQVRDFCYVDDTVSALLAIGRLSASRCDAFNVSSGVSHTVSEVASELIKAMRLDGVEISYSGRSWAGDAQRWEVSIKKLQDATGFAPRYGLREGLLYFVRWFERQSPAMLADHASGTR